MKNMTPLCGLLVILGVLSGSVNHSAKAIAHESIQVIPAKFQIPIASKYPLVQMTAESFFNRAMMKQSQGDYQGAIADHTQAIKLKPNDAVNYYNRGISRQALGDKQGAIADFQKAREFTQLQAQPNQ
jgi:tetratricopeptide (TPR) repeat protein